MNRSSHAGRALAICCLQLLCAFAFAQTPSADLSTTLIDSPDPIEPGDDIEYRVELRNLGPAPATDAVLALRFARGRALSIVQPEGWACTQQMSADTPPHPLARCTRGAMAAGLATFRFTLRTAYGPGPTVTSEGTTTSATPDPNATNDRGVATTSITGNDFSANLAVTLRAFGFATGPPGPYVIFDRVVVRNLGPDVARDVVLDVPLPEGTTFDFIAGTGSAGLSTPRGVCQTPAVGAPGTVRCTVDGIAPGEFFAPYIRTRVLPAFVDTLIRATASASASNTDPDLGNNQAAALALPQSLSARADLAISVIAHPDPVPPGGSLVYDVTITNLGPDPSNGLAFTIVHPLELGLEFEAPVGFGCGGNPIGVPPPVVTSQCAGEVIVGLGSIRFRLRARVPAHAIQPITVTFFLSTFATPDPQPANDSVTVTTRIGVGEGTSVPASSPFLLALLVLLLATIGARAARAN